LPRGVLVIEKPALDEWNLHGLKIAAADHALIGVDEVFSRRRDAAFHRDRPPGKHLTQRQRRDAAGGGHTGQALQPLPKLAIGGADKLRVFVFVAAHGQFQRENVGGVESRRNLLQPHQAAEKQAGHNQHKD
jgi:hypothetical protein